MRGCDKEGDGWRGYVFAVRTGSISGNDDMYGQLGPLKGAHTCLSVELQLFCVGLDFVIAATKWEHRQNPWRPVPHVLVFQFCHREV